MKIETLGGAAIAALILFVTGFLAVFQQDGVSSVSDISEAVWWILGGGAALSFLKDYQALSTRRLLAKVTGGKASSPAAVGIIAILLTCFVLSGCGIQRPQVDSISDGIAVTAADVETAAQTVHRMCRNTRPGGPCARGALLSTEQKESLKNGLQDMLDGLSLANLAVATSDYDGARSGLARTQAILAVLSAELARLQN